MAKFNIEVELDWIDNCEDGISVDDEIKEQVINGIKDELLSRATQDIVDRLDEEINNKISEATNLIKDRVDNFIEHICEEKIGSMQIPYKKQVWGNEVLYMSMTEFVGKRYEEFLNRKVFDRNGMEARYESERTTSLNEYFINKYLEKELAGKVSSMIQTAREDAEKVVLNTLEQNLREQLAAETIKRLNIPKLLENLQMKAIEFEKTTNQEN